MMSQPNLAHSPFRPGLESKKARNFPNFENPWGKMKAMAKIFRTNDQANTENMLGEKMIWGLFAL